VHDIRSDDIINTIRSDDIIILLNTIRSCGSFAFIFPSFRMIRITRLHHSFPHSKVFREASLELRLALAAVMKTLEVLQPKKSGADLASQEHAGEVILSYLTLRFKLFGKNGLHFLDISYEVGFGRRDEDFGSASTKEIRRRSRITRTCGGGNSYYLTILALGFSNKFGRNGLHFLDIS
jgi:hypothetical protein